VGFASENCCEKPYYSKEYLKHMNKAKSMWVIGDCDKGDILEHVEEALKINPISYEALIFCANIKHQLKDYLGVIEICNRILDNNSDNAIALFLRANSYYEMGQLECAKRDIRRSFEIRQDNPHAALLFLKLN
jgi:tetratricopeptide (TPR) repeat protein